jgi:MurE/MurF fusion protein
MVSITSPPLLETLLHGVSHRLVSSGGRAAPLDLPIATIATDSRLPSPGGLFVAQKGVANDGHEYIEKAVAAGCVAVVCEEGKCSPDLLQRLDAVVIAVTDSSVAYATLAANYFHRPAGKMTLVGITGTNGKTTITYLLETVLVASGASVGVIGTVNNRYTLSNGAKTVLDTRFTTPEAFTLQKVLREMADGGVEYVIMEVSSHALQQNRVGGLAFAACAFTNLTRDHLDYHADMESYFLAKAKLFSTCLRGDGCAVIPALSSPSQDRPWLATLYRICRERGVKMITWGEEETAVVRLISHETYLDRTRLELSIDSITMAMESPLVGRYNLDNLMVALGLAKAVGVEEAVIARSLATATGAPGRLQRVTVGNVWPSNGPVVLVDYAHSPDALDKVLRTVKALPHRDLYCVFGCGGDRDDGKRPVMGGIAASVSDVVVVTDDNPRSEDPDNIVARIVSALASQMGEQKSPEWLTERNVGDAGYLVVRDRSRAIAMAIRAAGSEDIVVIAGKGHETYQLTREGKRFFDDCLEAENALLAWTDDLVTEAVGGILHRGGRTGRLLSGVETDSRRPNRGGIFIALKGENHDAHDFLPQAIEQGASCLVVDRYAPQSVLGAASFVVVADPQRALGDLAAFRRRRLAALCEQKVIAITGSCGKTTVKEMVAAILARRWPAGPDHPENCVLKTEGNYNNLIGMPLSLFPLGAHHRAAVLEVGMNRPGELQRLAEIADADICCITNIHGAHLEGLGSIEGVARAKEELFAGAKSSATLIVNRDDPWVGRFIPKYRQHQVSFALRHEGGGDSPDFYASDINFERGGAITFTLHHRRETTPVHLFTAGEHNVANALAAAAIAKAAGAGLTHIASGLGDYRSPAKRMELLRSPLGLTVLNDSYNANPASMAAGLKTLKQLTPKTAVAIIGDMRELGEAASAAHFEIGRLVAELHIDYLGIVGDFKEDVEGGALSAGYPPERLRSFTEKDEAVCWIKEMVAAKILVKDDLILVKASRGLQFETITAALMDQAAVG